MKLPVRLLIAILSCTGLNSAVAQSTVVYQSSTAIFANPERGFYRYSETRSGNYSPLDQTVLESYRQLGTPPTANYSVYSTLVFRYFFLEDFKNSNISQTYLNNVQADFNTARAAGVKLIPRFAYTDEVDGSGCASFICPPYGDAPKNIVLNHITQLQPLLEANKDVIAAVQMGFIGVFGESYYTDFFGDASQGPDFKLTDANWADRNEVLAALLAAVPTERMVQVRYPQMKQRLAYGIDAPPSSPALTPTEAYSGSDKARVGFHNDCLLASVDDFGTYTDYGNSSTPSGSDTTAFKPYFAADSRYVVVGGETCFDGYSPQNDCASTAPAAFGDVELRRMHYSYLNAQYNNEVNNDWVTGGCMDDIRRELGYRFELQTGTYDDAARPGQIIDIDMDLRNRGYAAPYNARGVELVLRHTVSSETWFATLPDDPRLWFGDQTTYQLTESLCLPADLPTGDYELLLHLPDPMPTLYGRPEYSVRIANLLPDGSDPWEPTTGLNRLGHTLTVDNSSANLACNGEITFAQTSAILPVLLLDFSATAVQGEIELNWRTAYETNNESFRVERATDGRTFGETARLAGAGTTELPTEYVFKDREVDSGMTYYYRLRQVDADGTGTYSAVVLASLSGKETHWSEQIAVFPNPVHESLRIKGMTDEISVRLINTFGIEMSQSLVRNGTTEMAILPSGVYFLVFSHRGEQTVRRIVKW